MSCLQLNQLSSYRQVPQLKIYLSSEREKESGRKKKKKNREKFYT